jgi:hypothetical protein
MTPFSRRGGIGPTPSGRTLRLSNRRREQMKRNLRSSPRLALLLAVLSVTGTFGATMASFAAQQPAAAMPTATLA